MTPTTNTWTVSNTAVGHLLLATTPTIVAVPSRYVLAVSAAATWTAEQPPCLASALGIAFEADEPAWILRIGSDPHALVARATGRLRIAQLLPGELLPMPVMGNETSNYSHVVVKQGTPWALVLDVPALRQLHR